jgi:Family of unknown function (DUF6505)
VAEIAPGEAEAVIEALAQHLLERYGAPSLAAARSAAEAEAKFAASLCEHKVNTLIAVERSFGPEGIVERFRTIEPLKSGSHAKIWALVADDGNDGTPGGSGA